VAKADVSRAHLLSGFPWYVRKLDRSQSLALRRRDPHLARAGAGGRVEISLLIHLHAVVTRQVQELAAVGDSIVGLPAVAAYFPAERDVKVPFIFRERDAVGKRVRKILIAVEQRDRAALDQVEAVEAQLTRGTAP